MTISFLKVCANCVSSRTWACFQDTIKVQIVYLSSSRDTGWFILSLITYLKLSLNTTLHRVVADINIQKFNTIFSFLSFVPRNLEEQAHIPDRRHLNLDLCLGCLGKNRSACCQGKILNMF